MANKMRPIAKEASTTGAPGNEGSGEAKLPTMQRNALRKIFDRHEFTPEEVYALGYRRLQQAEGIGPKGLVAIKLWLQCHGYLLSEPPAPPSATPRTKKGRRSIATAVRLLRSHGYQVTGEGLE